MSFIIRLTSAWKTCFSARSRSSLICATFRPSNLIASSSLARVSESVERPAREAPRSSSTFGVPEKASLSEALPTLTERKKIIIS